MADQGPGGSLADGSLPGESAGAGPTGTGSARPLAVFDVDGVLADVRHRLEHVERSPKRWDLFFRAAPVDPPLPEGVALALAAADDCDVIYLTGRPEHCRRDTEDWLARHGLPDGPLHMRPARDHTPARRAKPQWLARAAVGRVVAVVVDDDLDVCDAYEAAGYRVIRADWMHADPAAATALRRAQEDEGRT